MNNNTPTEAYSMHFDETLRFTPYADDQEYIKEWNTFILACLVGVDNYKSECAENAMDDNPVPSFPGTTMGYEESKGHLFSYPDTFSQTANWIIFFEEATAHIESREAATLESSNELRLMRLRKLLDLSHFSCFALHCVLASEGDKACEGLFITLHGNENIPYPTLGTIQALYNFAFPNRKPELLSNPMAIENCLLFTPVAA